MSTSTPQPKRNWALLPRREPLTEERLRALFLREGAPRDGLRDRLATGWRRTLGRLLPLGGVSGGNSVALHPNGDEAFFAMLAAIEAARRRAWFEIYIFEPDELGARVLLALAAAAARGVEVVLLFDAFGSPRLGAHELAPLVAEGARVAAFNPLFGRGDMPPWVRNHRKILLCDDVGFSGGMNVSVDYGGERLGNSRFRDTMVQVRGPAVSDLARVFATSWRVATGEDLKAEDGYEPQADDVLLQVLSSTVRRERRNVQRALLHTITRSVERCWLTSPYFVPPPRLVRSLNVAARRGVDVRILTAGLSDVPLVRRASQHLYGRLLKRGVRVYEMFGRTLHAKTATIDGVYAAVGSFNLDYWSYRRLLEVNVGAVDRGVAHRLEAQFEEDLKISEEVVLARWERRSFFARVVDWLAYQLLRF
jgi:cardiolipin synthase A/B